MTFLDDFKNFIEKAKIKFGVSWQKLLEQIPDTDRLDSYRYDETLKKMVLLSQLPEGEVPILDENRNLKVETPNFYQISGKVLTDQNYFNIYELTFLADSITISFFQVISIEDNNEMIIYYDYNIEGITYNTENRDSFYTNQAITQETIQTDCKPSNRFAINFVGSSDENGGYQYILTFSKQKKTKISDIAYNSTTWDAITNIGASKNSLRDKIVSMIAEYVALISDIAYNESTWDNVTTIAPSKNAVRDKIEAMDTLTETEILALTWIEDDIDDLDHDDLDAIHDNVASEITAITEKETGVANDEFIIEDSVAENVKKSIKMSGLRITESQISDLDKYTEAEINLFIARRMGGLELDMYRATYNFKDDTVGSAPTGWTIVEGTNTEISVIASLDGHRKVLKFYDNDSATFCSATTPTWTAVADNNLELWFRIDKITTTRGLFIQVYEGATRIFLILINTNDLLYYDGAYKDIKLDCIVADTWYHIRIVPDDSANIYDVYLDGILEGNDLAYENNSTTGSTKIKFQTRVDAGVEPYSSYIDAVGIESDLSYNIGDNINDPFTLAEALTYVNNNGLALATTKVITSADEDLIFTFGRIRLSSFYSDCGGFSHRDCIGSDDYALLQNSSGDTMLNAKTGRTLYVRINNADIITIVSNLLTMNVPIAMGTNVITGCGDPTNDQDVATKKYVVDNFLAIAHYHDGHTLQLDAINSNGGTFVFQTSGNIEFKVSGDNDDYLVFMTDSGIPYIYAFGGDIIYFRSGTGGNWETLHANDFVNETPPIPTELCTESILNVKNTIDGLLDKKSLPKDVYYADKNGENEGMKLGSMVLHLVKTIQELNERITELEKNN